jgi:hypothetical protein
MPTLTDEQITSTANSIDKQVTRALLSPGPKSQHPAREPWSDELHFASLKVKYWRLTRANKTNQYNCSPTLAATNASLPAAHRQTPNPELSTAQSLNKAKLALLQARHDTKDLRNQFLKHDASGSQPGKYPLYYRPKPPSNALTNSSARPINSATLHMH